MKILHISQPNRKAAGVIAYTFHQEFKRRGHQSCLFVRQDSEIKDADIIAMYSPRQWIFKKAMAKIKREFLANCPRVLKKTLGSIGPLNPDYCPQSIRESKTLISSKELLRKFPFNPDVIILFFLDGFLNARNISEIYKATGARILWLPPDMAAMTGGCHYAWDCEGYKNLCGRCPAIFSNDPEDITRENMLFKQKHLKNVDIAVLAATEWIHRQAVVSTFFKERKIERVMVPVDEEQFKPGDKSAACRRFGISPDKKVIFFGAQSFAQRRKGMRFLIEALHILRDQIQDDSLRDRIHLLIAGRKIGEYAKELAFDYTYVGLLSMEDELPEAFRAADLFACPSIEDSGPMMINQSIMSGTPVVAFEMGVALDLVHTGVTGYRARLKDSSDFAKGLKDVLSLSQIDLNKMRNNCRRLGLSHIAASVQGERLERILMEQ